MTNKELINSFTDYLKANNKTVSTIVAYKKDLEQLSESNVAKKLTEFSSADIRFFMEYLKNDKKVSLKTLSRKLNSIRTFYRFLETKALISKNPALEVSHPKVKNKRPRVLTKYEYLALKEVSRDNDRLYTMIELLLQTGIRISEISKLRAKDVKVKGSNPNLIITAYSSNAERIVPLNPKIVSALSKYMSSNVNQSSNLFCTKSGKAIEVRNIRSSIDRILAKAEVKNACVNDIRNTFIVCQLNNGMSLTKVAEIVGHKNIATTTKYLTLLDRKYKPNGIDEVCEL